LDSKEVRGPRDELSLGRGANSQLRGPAGLEHRHGQFVVSALEHSHPLLSTRGRVGPREESSPHSRKRAGGSGPGSPFIGLESELGASPLRRDEGATFLGVLYVLEVDSM
jgi:hypothetical protein